jgi:hypothetical protein
VYRSGSTHLAVLSRAALNRGQHETSSVDRSGICAGGMRIWHELHTEWESTDCSNPKLPKMPTNQDLTKERLDCFDALAADFRADGTIPPKSITDCQFLKEEDDRLACYNGFLEPGSGSTKWHPARSPTLAPVPASPTAVAERVSTRIVHRSRGDADREADPGTGSPAGNVRAIAVLLDGAMVAVAPTIEAIRIGVIHLGTAEGAADNIEGARKPT